MLAQNVPEQASTSQQYDASSVAIKEKNSDLANVADPSAPAITPNTRANKKEPSMVDLALEKAEARER